MINIGWSLVCWFLLKVFDYVFETFIKVSQYCLGSCIKFHVFIRREWNFEDWFQISIWWQANSVLLREFFSSLIFGKPQYENIKFKINMNKESPDNWQNIDVTISLFIKQRLLSHLLDSFPTKLIHQILYTYSNSFSE